MGMTGKKACGSCGSSAGCGCGQTNPYEQSTQAVWHDPTQYSVVKHGPSFLPKLASKLTSAQKAEVQAFVKKQAAFYDTGPAQFVVPALLGQQQVPASEKGLPWILAYLRSLAHVHQTHHWQTRGTSFYADHLLFERLYNESLEFIDQVAERLVGLTKPSAVNAHQQIDWMHQIVKVICGNDAGGDSPDQMVQHSLMGEVIFLGYLANILEDLEETGQVSPGTRNLLEGVADKHEAFVYLLKQRHETKAVYSYDRS